MEAFKKDGEEYARVIRVLDDYSRCEAERLDGSKQRLVFRVPAGIDRVSPGDVILIGISNNQRDEEVDVIRKYSQKELRLLRRYGELPEKEGGAGGLMSMATFVGKFKFSFRKMAYENNIVRCFRIAS